MNTQPRATRILCYGDSNTWGKIPGSQRYQRYSASERWTGVLQEKLGQEYEIIEEGLNSRTTNLDDPDPTKPGRNGLQLLMPILESQHPIDTVILMLGTNDLKVQYDRLPTDIANGMQSLIDEMTKFAQMVGKYRPRIILISPPLVNENHAREMYREAGQKSQALAALYQNLAQRAAKENETCEFIDAAQYVEPSLIDGIHLEREGHQRLAEVIFQVLRNTKLAKTTVFTAS
jgi:lysophospholipase L1-like esterase